MAKDPPEQQKTDAGRVGRQGTGKLDADRDRLAEETEDKEPRPGRPGFVIGPTTGGPDVQLEPGRPSVRRRVRSKREETESP